MNSCLHSVWNLLSLDWFSLSPLVNRCSLLIYRVILNFRDFLFFKTRLETMKKRTALVINFYNDCIIVFTKGFKFGLYNRKTNLILARTNRRHFGLIWQISHNFWFKDWGSAILEFLIFGFSVYPPGLSHW